MAARGTVHGSSPLHPAGATPVRRLAADRRLQVTMVLRPAGLPDDHPVARKAALQKSAWPTERPLLSRAELETLYAPPDESFRRATQFAAAHGLTVVETSRFRHDVILEGAVADIERAFGVEQHEYAHESGSYHAHSGAIELPHDLLECVGGVLGLDSIPAGTSHASSPAQIPTESVPPALLARHYRFPAFDVPAGARVAILEFGGGLVPGDVPALLDAHGLPHPDLRILEIADGTGASPGNAPLDTDAIRAIHSGARAATAEEGPRFLYTFEVTMDVEIVAAFAPGVPIDLYFAPSSADGWRRVLYAALGAPYKGSIARGGPPAVPTVMSICWGAHEHHWGAMKMRLIFDAMSFAARCGVTICCSAGDTGSRDTDGKLVVSFPASSPTVLACGGSQLVVTDGRVAEEIVWNELVMGVPMASSGGMSGVFDRPPYQHGLDTPDPLDTWVDGQVTEFYGRWLPDVAALAAFSPGYELRLAGLPAVGGGTSASTPLWAALLARIGAALGRPLGPLGDALYALRGRGLRAVTRGTNDLAPKAGHPRKYEAGPGWNACTGIGVPDGVELLEALRAGRPTT